MRTFQAIVGLWALLLIGGHTIRHAYVLWIDPRDSVLDQFDETRQEILQADTLEELVALYEPAVEKVRAEDARRQSDPEARNNYQVQNEEPYKTKNQLEAAIREWESHHRQLVALHFYWWIGAALAATAAVVYLRVSRWLGISLFVLALLEMNYATWPSYASFGFPLEFQWLLTLKLVYSTLTLLMVLTAWWIGLSRWREPRPRAA